MIPLSQLSRPGGAEPSTLDRPLDHLLACHRRIEERLATLERVCAALPSSRPEVREAVANVVAFFDSSGVLHTKDEEESLFPRLRPKVDGEDAALLDRLEAEHATAEEVYAGLKALAGALDAPGFAAQAERLCALYRRHIQEEDATLIPLAERLLDAGELGEIAAEMRSRR